MLVIYRDFDDTLTFDVGTFYIFEDFYISDIRARSGIENIIRRFVDKAVMLQCRYRIDRVDNIGC